MTEREISVKEAAAALDCPSTYLSRLRFDKGKPGRVLATRIEELTEGRVKAPAWG